MLLAKGTDKIGQRHGGGGVKTTLYLGPEKNGACGLLIGLSNQGLVNPSKADLGKEF